MTRDTLSNLLGLGGSEYWSVFIRRLGASSVEIGLINSVSSGVNMLLALPSGWLTDRAHNLKKPYLVGRLVSLPLGLLRFLAGTWPFCMMISVWEMAAGRIMSPASEIIDIRSLSNVDRVSGLSLRSTVVSLAGLFGPMFSALVVTYFGGLGSAESIRPLFLLQFVFGVFIFAFEAWQLQDVTLARVESRAGVVGDFLGVFRESPIVTLHLLRDVVMTFTNQIKQPFTGIYLVDVKGADQFVLGWRGTAAMAVTVLFSLPGAFLADRFGRRRLAYYTRVFHWAGILIIIFASPAFPQLLVVESVFESLFLVFFTGWTAFRQETIPLQVRGRWAGANMLLNGLVGVVTPIVGGVIWNYNPDYIWWIGLFCDVFIVLPVMVIIGRKFTLAENKGVL